MIPDAVSPTVATVSNHLGGPGGGIVGEISSRTAGSSAGTEIAPFKRGAAAFTFRGAAP